MARPLALTPEVQHAIVTALRAGASVEDAVIASGVSTTTYYRWTQRGRIEAERLDANPRARPKAADTPYREFWEAVTRARAEFRLAAVAALQQSLRPFERRTTKTFTVAGQVTKQEVSVETVQPDGRLALEVLARQDPENWAKTSVVAHKGVEDAPPIRTESTQTIVGLSEEATRKAHEFLQAAADARNQAAS